MNPPSNTGSFGNGQMTPELSAAISRRSTNGPMNAVTSGAPTFDPTTQPPTVNPVSAPSGPPVPPPSVSGSSPTGAGTGLPTGSSEAQLILKTLDSRLKTISKIQEQGGQV